MIKIIENSVFAQYVGAEMPKVNSVKPDQTAPLYRTITIFYTPHRT